MRGRRKAAAALDSDVRWGVAGAWDDGRDLAQQLVAAGATVYEVNPRWTAEGRRRARRTGKNDRLDAHLRHRAAHGGSARRDSGTGPSLRHRCTTRRLCRRRALGGILGGAGAPPPQPGRQPSPQCDPLAGRADPDSRVAAGAGGPRSPDQRGEDPPEGDPCAQTASCPRHLARLAGMPAIRRRRADQRGRLSALHPWRGGGGGGGGGGRPAGPPPPPPPHARDTPPPP